MYALIQKDFSIGDNIHLRMSMSLSNLKTSEKTIFTVLLFMTVFSLSQPIQTWSQPSTGDNIQEPIPVPLLLSDCYVRTPTQPDDPARSSDLMEMNNVVSESIIKTIAVIKESFVCSLPSGSVLSDIAIYIRSSDDLRNSSVLNTTTVETLTCVKDNNGSILECVSQKPSADLTISPRCDVNNIFPDSPIAINTLVGNTDQPLPIKIMEADVDTFVCRDTNDNQLLRNVITFTDTSENFDNDNIERDMESVTCTIAIAQSRVLACDITKNP